MGNLNKIAEAVGAELNLKVYVYPGALFSVASTSAEDLTTAHHKAQRLIIAIRQRYKGAFRVDYEAVVKGGVAYEVVFVPEAGADVVRNN